MINRQAYSEIFSRLLADNKIILLSGPRQSGKTTFAKNLSEQFVNNAYFNWDKISDKKMFSEKPAFFQDIQLKDESKPLVILDEIHKYKNWKNYIKGIYDEFKNSYFFLVTGSGRLDLSRKGGDALTGRYFHMNLFPFSISELSDKRRNFKKFWISPLKDFDINDKNKTAKIWKRLFEFGGYPEPYVKQNEEFLLRWSDSQAKQIIRDDIRSFFDLKNIETLELLFSMLPLKIGSPLSFTNLAGDLQVSFDTVKNWIKILERFYIIFTLSTWTKKISRSILKSKKIYLFNYTDITNEPSKFENMVAFELHKAINTWNQLGYGRYALNYIRNKEKEEVDFIITENNQPKLLIEAKLSDDNPSKEMKIFQTLLKIPAVQLVNRDNIHKKYKNGNNECLIVTASHWLSSLPIK